MLSKVLKEEINALPRGVGRRNLMKPTQSMTSFVPDVLRNLYESSTRPGILPGLAGTSKLLKISVTFYIKLSTETQAI